MSMDSEVKIFFTLWIITICVMMIIGVLLFFHPTIVVNNYISSGNYTFDIGENGLKLINATQR